MNVCAQIMNHVPMSLNLTDHWLFHSSCRIFTKQSKGVVLRTGHSDRDREELGKVCHSQERTAILSVDQDTRGLGRGLCKLTVNDSTKMQSSVAEKLYLHTICNCRMTISKIKGIPACTNSVDSIVSASCLVLPSLQ